MITEIIFTSVVPPTFKWINSKFLGLLHLKTNHYLFHIKYFPSNCTLT